MTDHANYTENERHMAIGAEIGFGDGLLVGAPVTAILCAWLGWVGVLPAVLLGAWTLGNVYWQKWTSRPPFPDGQSVAMIVGGIFLAGMAVLGVRFLWWAVVG